MISFRLLSEFKLIKLYNYSVAILGFYQTKIIALLIETK